jgi:hypothetical protein
MDDLRVRLFLTSDLFLAEDLVEGELPRPKSEESSVGVIRLLCRSIILILAESKDCKTSIFFTMSVFMLSAIWLLASCGPLKFCANFPIFVSRFNRTLFQKFNTENLLPDIPLGIDIFHRHINLAKGPLGADQLLRSGSHNFLVSDHLFMPNRVREVIF